jgi:AN1-type zinc finger protein 2
MEFPDLGRHCEFLSCGQLEYCPLQCSYCHKWLCMYHQRPVSHMCKEVNKKIEKKIITHTFKPVYSNLCIFPGCKVKSIIPYKCKDCEKNFCVSHRLHTNHSQ